MQKSDSNTFQCNFADKKFLKKKHFRLNAFMTKYARSTSNPFKCVFALYLFQCVYANICKNLVQIRLNAFMPMKKKILVEKKTFPFQCVLANEKRF